MWLLRVLGLYAASRVFSTLLLWIALTVAVAHGWSIPLATATPSFEPHGAGWDPQLPGLADFSTMWDGSHYRRIVEQGYPSVLPLDHDGYVKSNDWAFLPLYPLLVRALMALTGSGFAGAGILVSVVCGAAASVLLFLTVRDRVGRRPAWLATALFTLGPLGFLLQLAYAESLFFFLFFSALYLMQRRRYLLMLAPAVLAAFTRPGELALALALAMVFVVRLRAARWGRDTDAFPVRQRVRMVVAGVVSAAAGLAWPQIAASVTGVPDAYTQTELSWRVGFLGHTSFRPFAGWFQLGGTYLGVFGVVVVIAAVLGFVWWLTRRSARRLGPEILATAASYGLYLFAVFMPQQSFFRVAVPASALLGDPVLSATRMRRTVLLVVAMLLQPVCVALLWLIANP